jgi:hypothetical protein
MRSVRPEPGGPTVTVSFTRASYEPFATSDDARRTGDTAILRYGI